MVPITLTWHAQSWYPVLLEQSCQHPILLPPMMNILLSPSQQPHPLIQQGHLKLAAWMITGKTCLPVKFQRTLPICSAPIPGGEALQGLTTAPGNSGVVGVANGRLIYFSPRTVASVADYLTELFNKGRSYHTINIHRSAISVFHRPIDGVKAGQHDLVFRVLHACFNVWPPQPRYVVTWDFDKVLSYIHSLGDNSSLSL